MPTTYTPIRYPGGKTKIYPEIKAIMEKNCLVGHPYAEVFAGGAGLAIKLLMKGDVPSIIINDYDRAVYCMWNAIVNNGENMCKFVNDVPLDIDTWLSYREVYRSRDMADDFELAKAAFYLNRTNVSGILGGGVIGGQAQTGNFKMDARFNRETLCRKIKAIFALKNSIRVTCLDAEEFISEELQNPSVFAYLDPPYVQKGPGLYRSSFDEAKHRALANVVAQCQSKWIITYDSDTLIEDIYANYSSSNIDIPYTANVKTVGKEKIILGPGLEWPSGFAGN